MFHMNNINFILATVWKQVSERKFKSFSRSALIDVLFSLD